MLFLRGPQNNKTKNKGTESIFSFSHEPGNWIHHSNPQQSFTSGQICRGARIRDRNRNRESVKARLEEDSIPKESVKPPRQRMLSRLRCCPASSLL